ncbi:hypothetical protein [Azospirillum agricola]|uniref:hypothetical protein n=1 Tax=Azospirillum agricola TaxID=1720247 RepID=UPI0015C43DBE|nr:hypothetical protein [Azospirillum agricola]
MDARHKAGHDEKGEMPAHRNPRKAAADDFQAPSKNLAGLLIAGLRLCATSIHPLTEP